VTRKDVVRVGGSVRMGECVVRMEMPKEGCHTCDARCVSDLYGYICGIERKNVMPFLGKKNRPDWCPIVCSLPEGHGRLMDADELRNQLIKNINLANGFDTSFRETATIVPAERSET
jgi:hypothetical protein